MTDAELIRAVQAGDATALQALYERTLPPVWRYVHSRLVSDVNAAEDVTSETFLAAVRGIRSIDPDRGPFVGWLIGIARHKIADHQRSMRRLADAPAAEPPGDDASKIAETGELRAAVGDVMAKMADDERIVLEWKYLDGLSVREIGARLGRTEKAAEALLYRARAAFRAMFERQRGDR